MLSSWNTLVPCRPICARRHLSLHSHTHHTYRGSMLAPQHLLPQLCRHQATPCQLLANDRVPARLPSCVPVRPRASSCHTISCDCCTLHVLTPRFMSLGYIGEFELVDDHRSGKIVVNLLGRINKCGVISPRFDISLKVRSVTGVGDRHCLACVVHVMYRCSHVRTWSLHP